MAAEVAVGVWAAEQVVSSGVQAGVGAYMVAKPTMPLKASFKQIATSKDDSTRLSLVRSGHTVTYHNAKAYIFGGKTGSGKLAGNEMHAVLVEPPETPQPECSVLPAVPDIEGEPVPAPRMGHAACRVNVCVAVYGGVDDTGRIVDSGAVLWLYVIAKSAWEALRAETPGIAPVQRSNARLFEYRNSLVLYGGIDAKGEELKDVWHFHYASRTWTPFPAAPVSTPNASSVNGVLYLISASDPMSSDVHVLDTRNLETAQWSTSAFPTNSLAPGPRPRVGAGLLPITTGYGRNYLLYFLGARQDPNASPPQSSEECEDVGQWSDLWTYQIPSDEPEMKATTSLADALKPAKIKDAIRSTLGYEDGSHSWAEVEVLPPGDLMADTAGKIHPGPRAFFACDVFQDGSKVIFWGGINAKGDREGDGWVISLS